MSDAVFLFNPPEPIRSMSRTSYLLFKLSSISERLANEDRTLVNHLSGRPENVAEHSLMLAIASPIVAEVLYPKLDPNLVARFSTIHDIVEAYVGDTPTHNIETKGLLKKKKLEDKGLRKLINDFAEIPSFVKLVTDYEDQKIPEARFVRVLDKCLPIIIHFIEGGKTLKGYIDKKGIIKNSEFRSKLLRNDYPEFSKLIGIRDELSLLAASELASEKS